MIGNFVLEAYGLREAIVYVDEAILAADVQADEIFVAFHA